jgi:uncharacterized membrane protein
MKYYSEQTKKLYDSPEELAKAEKDFEEKKAAELKKKEARETRAKEVADAYNKYVELFNAFVKDYGYYVDYRKSAGDEMLRVFSTLLDWPF